MIAASLVLPNWIKFLGLNPRIKLSIARGLAAEHKVPINFAEIIEPKDRYNGELGRRIYGCLGKIAQTFVTTNYDEWLDTEIADTTPSLSVNDTQVKPPQTPSKRPVFHEANDFTIANLNRSRSVFHIHGSLVKPDGMVITMSDYISRYRNDRSAADPTKENRILTFLDYLFRNRTVLFVGYSLSELEILEYVIQKARLVPDGGEKTPANHFMLQGFFSHEDTLMRSLTSYYRQCDIQLIPFLKDNKDYLQLVDVLENFAAAIPAAEPRHLERLMEMEKLLGD